MLALLQEALLDTDDAVNFRRNLPRPLVLLEFDDRVGLGQITFRMPFVAIPCAPVVRVFVPGATGAPEHRRSRHDAFIVPDEDCVTGFHGNRFIPPYE